MSGVTMLKPKTESPLQLEGPIHQLIRLTYLIQNRLDDDRGRKKLLASVMKIESEATALEASLLQITHTERWRKLMSPIEKAIQDIEYLWRRLELEWIDGSMHFDGQAIQQVWSNGYRNLLEIHDVVTGIAGQPWLEVYASLTRSDATANDHSSPSERTFRYLKTHILLIQIKALAILSFSGVAGSESIVEDWRESRFPSQLKACKAVLDAMPSSALWWGDMRTNGRNSPRSITCFSREQACCPDGQFALGFRFNPVNNLCVLQLYSGSMDSMGRFSKRSETQPQIEPDYFVVEKSEDHIPFWNINPIEGPVGYVLTGISLAVKTHDFEVWEWGPSKMGSYTYHIQEVYPVAEFKPLFDDGNMGSSALVLEPPHPRLEHDPCDQAYFIENGLAPWDQIGVTGWAYPSQELTAPCTGVRFRLNEEGVVHCAVKAHYHNGQLDSSKRASSQFIHFRKLAC